MTRIKGLVFFGVLGALSVGAPAHAQTLLNDTFADGNRMNTSLPTDSAVFIGQSAGNGSNSVTPGHLNFVLPTNSLKTWTYFTSDNSAPDANQPHNAVTSLGVGQTLTASVSFSATGITATTGKNFRFGLFHDPTDARVQSDVNSDGGGGTAPWTDALGYAINVPISSASGTNPIFLGKRTTSNASLIGSGSAFTAAPTGGTAYSMTDNTTYTLQLSLSRVAAGDTLVTATLLQGSTMLSTNSAHDLGDSFGGTAVGAGLLPGSQNIYTNFDQFMLRNSDATQATTLDFTNFQVVVVPEPATVLGLAAVGLAGVRLVRRRMR